MVLRVATFHSLKPLEIPFLAEEETGSRFLQESLATMDSRIVDMVFDALYGFVFDIMSDQFGCYVFAKLIKSCNRHQLRLITLTIISPIQDDLFVEASLSVYGSSSIKKLIKVLSRSTLIVSVLSALKRLFKQPMITASGLSIILHCLETLDNNKNKLLHVAALNSFHIVSCHKQGCVSVKNFVDKMSGPRKKQLLDLICMNSASLSKDSYGTYIVQHVIRLVELTCLALEGQFVYLSTRKEGSHIVEKILKNQRSIEHDVDDFLTSNRIHEIANDHYGNYVIQTALRETMRVNRFLYQRPVMKLKEEGLNSFRFGNGKNVLSLLQNVEFRSHS